MDIYTAMVVCLVGALQALKRHSTNGMDKLIILCMRNIVYVYYIYTHSYDVIQYMSTLLTNKYVHGNTSNEMIWAGLWKPWSPCSWPIVESLFYMQFINGLVVKIYRKPWHHGFPRTGNPLRRCTWPSLILSEWVDSTIFIAQ